MRQIQIKYFNIAWVKVKTQSCGIWNKYVKYDLLPRLTFYHILPAKSRNYSYFSHHFQNQFIMVSETDNFSFRTFTTSLHIIYYKYMYTLNWIKKKYMNIVHALKLQLKYIRHEKVLNLSFKNNLFPPF